jgi:hypothetical protein
MGVSAQLFRRCGGQRAWQRAIALRVVACLLSAALCLPAIAQAVEPQSWVLQDQGGHPWSLTLLEQSDPDYPAGLRLRLTDRTGSQRLDHNRPLLLRDGMGGSWELANRSIELVPAGQTSLPAGSAQYDVASLEPRPRAELPLALEVPLDAGGSIQLVAGASAVAALHATTGT